AHGTAAPAHCCLRAAGGPNCCTTGKAAASPATGQAAAGGGRAAGAGVPEARGCSRTGLPEPQAARTSDQPSGPSPPTPARGRETLSQPNVGLQASSTSAGQEHGEVGPAASR